MNETLESISLFQDLSAQQLEEVGQFCTSLSLSDGDMLIRESERNDPDLYLLCNGCVEIVSRSAPITSGEVVISKEDKDVFGEMAWRHAQRPRVRIQLSHLVVHQNERFRQES